MLVSAQHFRIRRACFQETPPLSVVKLRSTGPGDYLGHSLKPGDRDSHKHAAPEIGNISDHPHQGIDAPNGTINPFFLAGISPIHATYTGNIAAER